MIKIYFGQINANTFSAYSKVGKKDIVCVKQKLEKIAELIGTAAKEQKIDEPYSFFIVVNNTYHELSEELKHVFRNPSALISPKRNSILGLTNLLLDYK